PRARARRRTAHCGNDATATVMREARTTIPSRQVPKRRAARCLALAAALAHCRRGGLRLSSSRHRMRHVLKFLTRLPLPLLYALGHFAYFVAFHVLRWHRDLAARNLANAFPEKSAEERAALLRQSFVNLGETLAETFWGFGASAAQLAQRVAIDNPEVIERLVATKHPVVV